MPNYRRSFVPGGCFFFTVALRNRRSSLLTDHIALLRSAISVVRTSHPFEIDAWVVLPDHMHCVWTLPEGETDYPIRWRLIKTLVSKGFPARTQVTASQMKRREKGIWQRRFWEHTIRDEVDFERHVDYIHVNPVKNGLVRRVRDWPYSTFHRYVRAEVLPVGWGGVIEDLPTACE